MPKPSVIKAVSVGLNPGNVGAPGPISKVKTKKPKPSISKGARFAKALGEAMK